MIWILWLLPCIVLAGYSIDYIRCRCEADGRDSELLGDCAAVLATICRIWVAHLREDRWTMDHCPICSGLCTTHSHINESFFTSLAVSTPEKGHIPKACCCHFLPHFLSSTIVEEGWGVSRLPQRIREGHDRERRESVAHSREFPETPGVVVCQWLCSDRCPSRWRLCLLVIAFSHAQRSFHQFPWQSVQRGLPADSGRSCSAVEVSVQKTTMAALLRRAFLWPGAARGASD